MKSRHHIMLSIDRVNAMLAWDRSGVLVWAGCFWMGLCAACGMAAVGAEHPNIIIMMADDMGVGDTSAYQDFTGNADAVQVKTPAMDRLARMGIRFTDAHSPSSRCSASRYTLLSGRYSWRTRLKYSVLWGPQADPLIEPDRPTIATMLREQGYRTGMTGKWHVGLIYRDETGQPAAKYEASDFRRGIADGPLNHGFDFFHGTARSHPTSKPQGWLWGDRVVAAIGAHAVDAAQYVLNETGPKNYEMAIRFLNEHLADQQFRTKPFFLYYAAHANHASHDPAESIAGHPVRGRSHPGGARSDFIYENDVALGLVLDFLASRDDPRRSGHQLIENTLVVFTSDNGAEIKSKVATGPLRSHKGSVYEGGHRVPFLVSWPLGEIGDGRSETPGISSESPISHVDLFATLAELTGASLPEDGAEDSASMLAVWRGHSVSGARTPLIHNDHNEGVAKGNANNPAAAWLAIRMDDPIIEGQKIPGQWKLLVDEGLLMRGEVHPRELYELRSDLQEAHNRIAESPLEKLVVALTNKVARIHHARGIRMLQEVMP